MTWVRIDDLMPQHPKLAKVGPVGLALQIAGLCYCNRYLTDGFIPADVVPGLLVGCDPRCNAVTTPLQRRYNAVSNADVTALCEKFEVEIVAKKLVDAAIWVSVEGGYSIHDYLQYQPSRADVLREREQIAKRVREYRGKRRSTSVTPLQRRYNAVSNGAPKPNPKPNPNPNSNNTKGIIATTAALLSAFSAEELHELRGRFPSIDVDWEAGKCVDWHVAKHGGIKAGKATLKNWLDKATPGANGETRGKLGKASPLLDPGSPDYFFDRPPSKGNEHV